MHVYRPRLAVMVKVHLISTVTTMAPSTLSKILLVPFSSFPLPHSSLRKRNRPLAGERQNEPKLLELPPDTASPG